MFLHFPQRIVSLIICFLRPPKSSVTREYEELQKEVRLAKERRGQCCYICNNKNERIGTRLLYGIIIQAINQLSGINVFVVFTPIMMAQSFDSHGALMGGFTMNVVNLLVEFGVLLTVERLGRPMLLFVGAECMFVALCMIIWIESVIDQQRPGPSDVIMYVYVRTFFFLSSPHFPLLFFVSFSSLVPSFFANHQICFFNFTEWKVLLHVIRISSRI